MGQTEPNSGFFLESKGQHDLGQQDRESPRGESSSERVSERASERYTGNED